MMKISMWIRSISLLGIFLNLGLMTACNQSSGTSSSDPVVQGPAQPPDPAENDSSENPTPAPGDGNDSNSSDRVTFDDVNDRIIVPRCVECHGASGGVNLEGYARVKNEVPAIKEVVLKYKMMPPPEKEPLTEEELELLKKWIDQGAP